MLLSVLTSGGHALLNSCSFSHGDTARCGVCSVDGGFGDCFDGIPPDCMNVGEGPAGKAEKMIDMERYCEEYQKGSSHKDVTNSGLKHIEFGVPRTGYAFTKTIFKPASQFVNGVFLGTNKPHVGRFPVLHDPDMVVHPLVGKPMLHATKYREMDCSVENIKKHGATGQTLLDCLNSLLEVGETTLAIKVCELISKSKDGAGKAFCEGDNFLGMVGVATHILNKALDDYVVEPAKKEMEKVCEAVSTVFSAVYNTFWSFWESDEGDEVMLVKTTIVE